jgi:hypothetical protein
MYWWLPDSQLHFLPLCIIILFVIILLNLMPQANVFAQSPPFIRQEVRNPPNWTDMVIPRQQIKNGPAYTEINSVTYSSNGKFLNSTLWLKNLNELHKSHWKPKIPYLAYGIMIDSDLNTETGDQGIDYQLEINWNHTAGKWTRTMIEYASNGQHRSIVTDITNYTKFLENVNGNYIQLDLDLSKILSPPKYRVFFYAYSLTNDFQWLLNAVRWIYVPPIEFKMWTLPSSIDLISGRKGTVDLYINNPTGFQSSVTLATNHTSDVKVEVENKTLKLPRFTVAKTTLNIYSSANEGPAFHTIDINGAVDFPPQSFRLPGSFVPIQINASKIDTRASVPISVSLEEAPSALEAILRTWNQIGGVFSLIYIPPLITFIVWLVTNIPRGFTVRRQTLNTTRYMQEINNTYDLSYQNKDECEKKFEQIRRKIAETFAKGKINESTYKILNDKISYYLKKIEDNRSE